MKTKTKKILKKTTKIFIPCAITGALVATFCFFLDKGADMGSKLASAKSQLIEEYKSTDEYTQDIENYKSSLQSALDAGIITSKEYNSKLKSKTSNEAILNNLKANPNYVTEIAEIDKLNKETFPYVAGAAFTGTASLMFPIGCLAFKDIIKHNKRRPEDNPYGNEYAHNLENDEFVNTLTTAQPFKIHTNTNEIEK